MTRYEFYSNLQEYKKKNDLKHGMYDQKGNMSYQPKYYQKVDLGNGKTRYFYSKEEWDIYQKDRDFKKKYQEYQNKIKKAKQEYNKNRDAALAQEAERKAQIELRRKQEEARKANGKLTGNVFDNVQDIGNILNDNERKESIKNMVDDFKSVLNKDNVDNFERNFKETIKDVENSEIINKIFDAVKDDIKNDTDKSTASIEKMMKYYDADKKVFDTDLIEKDIREALKNTNKDEYENLNNTQKIAVSLMQKIVNLLNSSKSVSTGASVKDIGKK